MANRVRSAGGETVEDRQEPIQGLAGRAHVGERKTEARTHCSLDKFLYVDHL